VQTFVDPASPRNQLPFEQLPRGVVKFPPQVVDAISLERGKFAPGVFTEEYARKEEQKGSDTMKNGLA